MLIRSIRHKGLRDLIVRDDARGVRRDQVARIKRIVAALVIAPDVASVMSLPGWRLRRLRGERAGSWSVSVSGNWRITFEVRDDEIVNLTLEDYH